MIVLLLAAILWVAVHVGLAGTRLRATIAGRLGDNGFRGLFSVLSVASIVFLVIAYNAAPTRLLWFAPTWLLWLLALVMFAATILLAGSVLTRNPTAINGDGAPIRGIFLITRHPMLWSFSLWAAVHMVGNGDTASLLFFGAFLVTSLAGMPSIDAKIAARDPAYWRTLSAETSIVPFARGFRPSALTLPPLLVGAAIWAVLFLAHPYVVGVSPVR